MKINNSIKIIIIVIFSSLPFLKSGAQRDEYPPDFAFKNLRTESGLSHSRVTAIEIDSRGFVWIGTQNGINIYDGYEFRSFTHNPSDTTSISENYIRAIYRDGCDNIWIGTENGYLNRYCREKNCWENFSVFEKLGVRGGIKKIIEDTAGNFWIGFIDGLVKFNPTSRNAIKFPNPDFPSTSGTLETFYIDSFGRFWVGFWEGGLYLFNPINGTYTRFTHEKNQTSFNKASVMCIKEDAMHNLWLGTYNQGLIKLSHPTLEITIYNHDKNNSFSLNNNQIKTIEIDNHENIWVGTEEGGLDYFEVNEGRFYHYFSEYQEDQATEGASIYSLKKGTGDQLWIGSRENGLFLVNATPVPFKYIGSSNDCEKILVTALCEDDKRKVWAAVKGDVAWINFEKRKFEPLYLNLKETPTAISFDKGGRLWIGGLKGGIYSYDFGRHTLKTYQFPETENQKVFSFLFLNNDEILVLFNTLTGKINSRTNTFKTVNLPSDMRPYDWETKENHMFYIGRSKLMIQNNLQVDKINIDSVIPFNFPNSKCALVTPRSIFNGTDAGLFLIDRHTTQITYLDKLPGPVNYEVNAVLPGKEEEIWFSTDYQLVRYEPNKNHFRIFNQFDGIPPIYFRDNVGIKLKNGILVFGGDNGITFFNPDEIKSDLSIPALEFTAFTVGNRKNKEEINLEPFRKMGKKIKLKYNQNFFTIKFSLLHFQQPEKVLYRFRLTDFDKEWNEAYNLHQKTYMNLPYGNYTFKIQGRTPENQWSSIEELYITINPPLWFSWYAYPLYFVVFVFLLYIFRNFNIKQERLKTELKVQQIKTENIEKLAQKETELNESKLRFFTNISHEFKTPLTLIISPLEQYMETLKPLPQEILKQIYDNAQKLKQLVSQVMDIRKIDQGSMKINYTYDDIVRFTNNVCTHFKTLAEEKHLDFEFIPYENHIFTQFDRDKMEKIFNNLIYNAIQYTDRGKIIIEIKKYRDKNADHNKEEVEVIVSDTGMGIPPEDTEKIFNRFYQVNFDKRQTSGTGIGLALVKELVTLHQGSIQVESIPNKGSRFIVRFPLLSEKNESDENYPIVKESADKLSSLIITHDEITMKNRQTILIVEDNREMRHYLAYELGGDYEIIEAENGEEAFDKCLKNNPDLILSDIMMPSGNGIDFCKQIKSDESTSHIPLLFITALSGCESQEEGYVAGADDYITKPFNITVLKEKIKNFLSNREKLKLQYIHEAFSEPEILKIASADEKFLKKANEIIEKNLSNSNFDIDDFAREMATSRSQLYRKLKTLTGLSASEFIKITRLKIAARLIKEKNYTISEAAYQVGFIDPRYFAKCFQKQFGVIPSKFKNRI